MPVGLTTIVDTTVGGTLSVGGVGGESFRTGAQVDQVLELEVATVDGRITRCSAEQHSELFDAVRAGIGQCGVIVGARYPLRQAKARLRSYTLVCPDGRALVADMQTISRDARVDFMFGAMIWSAQRGWQLLLLLGKEHDDPSELDDTGLLSGLHSTQELARADSPLWQLDGRPGHPFIRLFEEPDAETLRRPWVDHVCEPHAAGELMSAVLAEPMVAARARTSGVVLGIAPHARRAPLFQPQTEGPLILLGLSPEASDAQLQDALVYLRRHNQRGAAVGGKRYMSGFIEGWSAREWAAHFGESWTWFRGMRERVDPRGLLNNAHVRWQ
jgi:cytokinin dehydrogenase